MNAFIENLNFQSDYRVRARRDAGETFVVEDEDGEKHQLPTVWAVCPTCKGEGKHTNPSIDAGGLSEYSFGEDSDFADEYLAGAYDVACYQCSGRRVVNEVDEPNLTPAQRNLYEDYQRGRREDAADYHSERYLRAIGG